MGLGPAGVPLVWGWPAPDGLPRMTGPCSTQKLTLPQPGRLASAAEAGFEGRAEACRSPEDHT